MKKAAIIIAVVIALLVAIPIVVIEFRQMKVKDAVEDLTHHVPHDWRLEDPKGRVFVSSPCDFSACHSASIIYVVPDGSDPVVRGRMAKVLAESRGWTIKELHGSGEIEARRGRLYLSIAFSDADGDTRLVSRARIGVSDDRDSYRWGG